MIQVRCQMGGFSLSRQSRAASAVMVTTLHRPSPHTMETIVIPDPGPGEAVVAIQACGVCHTDLHYREGGINDEFPFLLGHEAAGLVESVGEGVTNVVPGDYVILNWRAVCGDCRACRRGQAQYCFNTHNANLDSTLVFDPAKASWADGPKLNSKRSSVNVCVFNGSLTVIGGFDGTRSRNDCEVSALCLCVHPWDQPLHRP